jgi:sugar lactone lactonase YvrE
MDLNPDLLLDGLVFPEGPRWHEDRLWISDMHAHRVLTVELTGHSETVAELHDKPSGLGFLPDGTPIVVSMRDRLLLRIHTDGRLSTYADLTTLPGDSLNDMVIDGRGHAYIGTLTRRDVRPEDLKPSDGREGLVLVPPDRTAMQVADDMLSPNGSVVTPDNSTLIVAEHRANRIDAFDICDDGSLKNRRVYADTAEADPDGIALDAEGAIWIAAPQLGAFRRIFPGGRIAEEIKMPAGKWAVACALGGPHRRTLFLLTSWQTKENMRRLVNYEADKSSTSRGAVEVVTADVPGVGWP